MKKKKKILIIYASYGAGHKAIANYIANHFKNEDKNLEIATLDMVTYSMKIVGNISQKVNLFVMLKTPYIHNFFYNIVSNKIAGDVIDELAMPIFKNKRMKKMVTDFNPDIVIATIFFGASLAAYYQKKGLINSKIIATVTDYDVIELWMKYHKRLDYIVVANDEMKKDLLRRKVDKKKIKVFGIPIAPQINSKFNRKKSLEKYNFTGERPICIFFGGGGNGSSMTIPYIRKVALSNHNMDIIFIAGKNETSKKYVDDLVKKYNLTNIRVLGFADNIPELLELGDFVVSKPGGIQLTECLYFKKPVLMIKHSGGQEIANYKYFEAVGCGKFFKTHWGLNKYISMLLKDENILSKYQKNMKKINNNDAMDKLYNLVVNLLK